jgi:integrase
MGLGSYPEITLAAARQAAAEAREQRRAGVDPIEARDVQKAALRAADAKVMTFRECAEAFVRAHQAGWRNAKHRAQWQSTLETYAGPFIGALSVQFVDTGQVMRVLEQSIGSDRLPLWEARPETASRLRGRIESILDWARVRGHRSGENPARWRGHLDHLLPSRRKVRGVRHHAAVPYSELPAFMVELQQRPAVAARGLEFLILTASRAGMVVGATWSELDLMSRVWTIPGPRMKSGREYRVPLSDAAMRIIESMQAVCDGEFVFPGERRHGLSNMAFTMLLRRMKREQITAHGFRATFRTWAAETTTFHPEVVEAALAHVVGNKVEAAYQRGDLFEKRRLLMAAWSEYCLSHCSG